MGMELLDIQLRLEKAFGVELPDGWPAGARVTTTAAPLLDMTAGDLHDALRIELRRAGRPVPHGSWDRVRVVIAEAIGVPPGDVRAETWLVRDLGASL